MSSFGADFLLVAVLEDLATVSLSWTAEETRPPPAFMAVTVEAMDLWTAIRACEVKAMVVDRLATRRQSIMMDGIPCLIVVLLG